MKRRDLLKAAEGLLGGLATSHVFNLAGCNGEAPAVAVDDGDVASGEVLLGLYPSDETASSDVVRQGLSRLDLSWLRPGDAVFVKVACNSGRVHPAVTAPAAVVGLCEELFSRGAGRVVVGDQSGVESVRLTEGEVRYGSTRALMESNGLYGAIVGSGAEAHFFDDQGFADGYIEATLPPRHHWGRAVMIPRIVQEVDHIVYLPRLSSHALAGYTHGLKTAVGWLRDDSRHHMHHDAATLHEKYVEISFCEEIASRLRLVLSFAEAMLLHQGPDTGTVAVADPRILIASDDIAHHDAFGAAVLRYFDVTVGVDTGVSPYGDGSSAAMRNDFFLRTYVENATGIPWGDGDQDGYSPLPGHAYWEAITADLALSRAHELGGGAPTSVVVRRDGAALAGEPRAALDAAYAGLFDIRT